jgi:uncharacterized lipoprotein YmbA
MQNEEDSMTVMNTQRVALPALLALLLLVGCATGSPPVKFYTLNALEASGDLSGDQGVAARHLSIGLGPVELPEMLDRPQIITRAGTNRLQLAEFDRWAGSLRNDFSSTLAENLSALLNTDDIVIYPWGGGIEIDYQVEVEVARFDAVLEQNATLNARWKLSEGDSGKVLKGKRSVFKQPIEGQDYEAVVAALNRTLDAFSQEIAEAIQAVAHSRGTH